ncbi:MAG: hypothetical protein JRI86_13490 [Deltaproteobacteria bacterium]|nr:hypothetical protein [Deltaproteobacteria bacterium]
MGYSAVASCSCGYESLSLMIGGGLLSFTHFCAFPAYCPEGDHLVTVNMFDKPLSCPDGHKTEPIPYDHDSLVKTLGKEVVASWEYEDLRLEVTDGLYFCPACHNLTLTFSNGDIMWD